MTKHAGCPQIKDDPILQRFNNFIFALDIRGCKEHTHSIVETGTLSDAFLQAEEKLWRTYPFLNQKLMTDRKQGELYFDIAVELVPRKEAIVKSKILSPELQEEDTNTNNSVVGLWCLEGLACSFKATGFNSPSLFPMGTLSQYGSATAVMGKLGRHYSHIAKRMCYCGIYNLNRAQDNMNEYFKQTEPPTLMRKHIENRMKIQDIYEKELTNDRSFGIRIEDRINGASFRVIIALIGHMVRALNQY
jgi:hypothetical protein